MIFGAVVRLFPGAAPGDGDVLLAVSGGESTIAAQIWRSGSRGRSGASSTGLGSPGEILTMELLACIALEFSRTDMTEGKFAELACGRGGGASVRDFQTLRRWRIHFRRTRRSEASEC